MKPKYFAINNPSLVDSARTKAHAENPRLKNWKHPQPSTDCVRLGYFYAESFRYKGEYRRFMGYNYIPRYFSRLSVFNKFQAKYEYGFAGQVKSKNLRAPVGMEWAHDGSLVLSHDYTVEYHPTLEDLLSRNFAERIRAGIADAKQKRLKDKELRQIQLKDEIIFANESPTVRVTLYDSRRAGNCIEGSLRYAESRLGISREAIMAAPWMVGVEAGRLDNSEPCHRAIRQAWLRETTVQI